MQKIVIKKEILSQWLQPLFSRWTRPPQTAKNLVTAQSVAGEFDLLPVLESGLCRGPILEISDWVAGLGLKEEVSLSDLRDELLLRVIRVAEGRTMWNPTEDAHPAFLRLETQEKALLLLLARGGYSYERLGKVLGLSSEHAEEIAWSLRLKLATAPELKNRAMHPMGSSRAGLRCPEYYPSRPWTQRFLDSQIRGKELIFLKTHLENCESCREVVKRAKAVYFLADELIPRSLKGSRDPQQLEKIYLQTRRVARPLEQPWGLQVLEGAWMAVRSPAFTWVGIGSVLLLLVSWINHRF